jgi:hypothetical protein
MTIPDGRPLYAYKCDDKKYIALKEQLIGQLRYLNNKGASVTKFPYYFCLYAAETFCREHVGGSWSWDTIFEPLGIETPQQKNKFCTSDFVCLRPTTGGFILPTHKIVLH